MASWEIHGVWSGVYEYNLPTDGSELGPSDSFTLRAERGWFGRVRGIILDRSRAPDDAAKMVGRVCGTRIVFRKTYQSTLSYHGGRVERYSAWLRENYGIVLDAEPLPTPVNYQGEFDEARQIVKGTWRIRPEVQWAWSAGQPIQLSFPECTGTWAMWRDRDLSESSQ